MLIISLPFQMLAPTLGEFFRISMYFNIFIILLIPEVINSIKNKYLKVISILFIIILLLIEYFLFTYNGAGVYPYKFLWE